MKLFRFSINVLSVWLSLVFVFSYVSMFANVQINQINSTELPSRQIISCAAFSNKRSIWFSAKGSIKNTHSTVFCWNLPKNSIQEVVNLRQGTCKEIKFSKNNRYLCFNYGSEIELWEWQFGRYQKRAALRADDGNLLNFDISDSKNKLICVDNSKAVVWDILTDKKGVINFDGQKKVYSVKFMQNSFFAIEFASKDQANRVGELNFYELDHLASISSITTDELSFSNSYFWGMCSDEKLFNVFNINDCCGNFYTFVRYGDCALVTKSLQLKMHKMHAPSATGNPNVALLTGSVRQDWHPLIGRYDIVRGSHTFASRSLSEAAVFDIAVLWNHCSDKNLYFYMDPSLRLICSYFTYNNELLMLLANKNSNFVHAISINVDFSSPFNGFILRPGMYGVPVLFPLT